MRENPLREGLGERRAVEPCALVIFGATGDLTHRKLIPALCNLAHEGQLPANFAIVGFARRPKNDDEFRQELRAGVEKFCRFKPINPAVWDAFAERIFYHQSDFTDADGYARLGKRLQQLNVPNHIFYLATPPTEFVTILRNLAPLGAGQGRPRAGRIVVEKPFGRSLDTARELNRELAGVFSENQVYRIDHYLGKETVQNIMALRFANEIFEPLWNAKYVDHLQITVAETLGVEGRGGYYDESGALRDMVQNHMMQLLSLVAMEPPISLAAGDIHNEKAKVLRAVRAGESVRGQYAGYRDEPRVAKDSRTETFVALKLWIDNWRWAGVPFYLRHGKRLPKGVAEIAIQFKAPPAILFSECAPVQPNVLVLRIQPDEGIAIRMNAKVPGTTLNIQPVKMDFRYGGSFGARSPDAYERLLHDVIAGDSTLFTRNDEVETSWALIDAVIAGWKGAPATYEAGSWGPAEADEFIQKDGRQWRRP